MKEELKWEIPKKDGDRPIFLGGVCPVLRRPGKEKENGKEGGN